MPMEAGPHVGAALAAGLADEPIFDVGEPDIVRPLIAADRDVVAALVIRAIDQDTANPDSRTSPNVIFCGQVAHLQIF